MAVPQGPAVVVKAPSHEKTYSPIEHNHDNAKCLESKPD